MGLSEFWVKISDKKRLVHFAFGFGVLEPRPDWVHRRVSLHVLSRLKGIETGDRRTPIVLEFALATFRLHVLSRLKGIETKIAGNLREYGGHLGSLHVLSRLKGN